MKRNNYLILSFIFLSSILGFSVYGGNQSNNNKLDIETQTIIRGGKSLGGNQLLETKSTTSKKLIQDSFPYMKGEIIVKFKEKTIDLKSNQGLASLNSLANSKGLKIKGNNKKGNIALLKTEGDKSVDNLILELSKNPDIEYVEPNYIAYPLSISSNDTYKTNMWGLDNTGQYINGNTSTIDADMDWVEAMGIFEGNPDQNITGTIVAIIDTGIGYNHPDLINQMWDGTNCKDQNGNPLGGCIHGYDFGAGDKNPLPLNSSHGTHIAGTIAAEMNNAEGIIGVNPNGKIMALKASRGLDDILTLYDIIRSIDFAIQNGAKIINASYGSTGFSQSQYDAIERFKNAGGIFVTAAGNGSFDGGADYEGDEHGVEVDVYPCDFDLDNIICTAATDTNDDLANFSDYGSSTVDVGAPGGTRSYNSAQIFSTIVKEKNIHLTGNLSETPEGEVPSVFTVGGIAEDWGVEYTPQINVDAWLKAEYNSAPYSNLINTYVISDELNILTGSDSSVEFYVWCDTAIGTGDSANFFVTYEGVRYYSSDYNEDSITYDSITILGGTGNYQYVTMDLSQFSRNDMQIGFEWTTDLTGDNNHIGCAFGDIKVYGELDGSDGAYGWKNGTSMATPHVAGLASLAYSYRPDLSYKTIIGEIIDDGDSISSLSGKTVSGKRVNANNTLNAITEPNGTINFQEGDTTTTGNVTLDLTAVANFSYLLSGDILNTYTGTINGPLSIDVELLSGSGEKTVGLTLTNGLGEITTIYDNITLDTGTDVGTGSNLNIDGGAAHTCMINEDKTVSCWGLNTYGQLGDGTNHRRLTPTIVPGISNASKVVLGKHHSCALLEDKTVKCWGYNYYGQLGDATRINKNTPIPVSGISNVIDITLGSNHTCVVLEDNTVKCWGRNNKGQLGDGTQKRRLTPVTVNGIAATKISAGELHTCAILDDNSVKCWGQNYYGQLGNNATQKSTVPVVVIGISSSTSLEAGAYHSCVVLSNDSVKCWGKNGKGQIGDGTRVKRRIAVSVSNISSAKEINLGKEHSCVVLDDNSVKCWGRNDKGQIGDGTQTRRPTPVVITGVSNVSTIGLGERHSCAILSDNSVKCWGKNGDGQLGDGTRVKKLVPTDVSTQ